MRTHGSARQNKTRLGKIVPLLAALAMLAGCGGAPASQQNASVSAGQLRATSQVQFGSVQVGAVRSGYVVMTNTGTAKTNITVSNVNVTGPGFELISTPTLPFIIPAGGSVTVGVNFSPPSTGSATGSLSIASNASASALSVNLAGSGGASSQVVVAPAILNFGNVALGGSSTLNGNIVAGNSPVTITTVDQAGQGYALSGINFPVSLAAGQSLPFTVTFTPQAAGSASGSIAFVTNGSSSPSAILTGAGGSSSSSGHSVSLSWSPSTSPVTGYNIYRSLQSGGPYAKVTASPQPTNSYVDSSVQAGATYYYVATSVNGNSGESGYSNQIAASVP